jgi:hypothetical protein
VKKTYEEVAPVVLHSPEDPEPHRGADEERYVLVHALYRGRVEAAIRQFGVEALVHVVIASSSHLLSLPPDQSIPRRTRVQEIKKEIGQKRNSSKFY